MSTSEVLASHLQTSIRRPFVLAALVLMLFVLALELGAPHLVGGSTVSNALGGEIEQHPMVEASLTEVGEPPGRGLSYLAQIDLLMVLLMVQYTIAQMGLGRVHGRVTGIVTLVVSALLILAGIVLLMIAVVEVVIMITLASAAPFGTIAYLAIWGGFPRAEAGAVLATLVVLEVGALLCLVLAHPSFVRQKGLLVVGGLSLLLKLILGFLHALVPRSFVAITDNIGAIVTAVVAIVVAVFFMAFAVPSIVKALRVDRLL